MFIKLSKILDQQISENPDDREVLLLKLAVAQKWPECVGKEINRNTSISSIKDGILFAATTNAVWASHLTALKKEILDKLNSAILPYTLKDIRFKPSYKIKAQYQEKKSERKLIRLTAEEQDFIEVAAAEIKDREMRDTVKSIIEKDLIWQKEKLENGGGICSVCKSVFSKKGICLSCKRKPRTKIN